MPETAAEFYSGPHDGLVLDIDEIKRYCHLVKIQGNDEGRLFAMMPTLIEWHHVLRGSVDKDGPFDMLYPYELGRHGGRPAFLFRRYDEFSEAVEGHTSRP